MSTTMSAKQALILYVRPHCHLCREARTLLSALALPFTLVNIDDDPDLQAQYHVLVPVLYAPWCDAELIYPFDAARVAQWLSALPE